MTRKETIGNLADPRHKNHYMEYIQSYISSYGIRKCEANALVIRPEQATQLCKDAIEHYLGKDASARIQKKEELRNGWFNKVRETISVGELNLAEAIRTIENGLDEYDTNEEEQE